GNPQRDVLRKSFVPVAMFDRVHRLFPVMVRSAGWLARPATTHRGDASDDPRPENSELPLPPVQSIRASAVPERVGQYRRQTQMAPARGLRRAPWRPIRGVL